MTSPDNSPTPPTPVDPRDADLRGIRGWLFDLDGVLTPTAEVHMHAWERMFTPFLEAHGASAYSDDDYFEYLDGKKRYDGVRACCAAATSRCRGAIRRMPRGRHGVRHRQPQERRLRRACSRKRASTAYPGSLALLDALHARGHDRRGGLELEERRRGAARRGSRRPVRGRDGRRHRRAATICPPSPRPTCSSARPSCWASTRRGLRRRRRRRVGRAVRRGRRLRPRRRRRPRRRAARRSRRRRPRRRRRARRAASRRRARGRGIRPRFPHPEHHPRGPFMSSPT